MTDQEKSDILIHVEEIRAALQTDHPGKKERAALKAAAKIAEVCCG